MHNMKISVARWLLSLLVFYLIIWVPPIGMPQKPGAEAAATNQASPAPKPGKPAPAGPKVKDEFVLRELDKANNEISQRIAQQDTWYQWKFAMAGAAFLSAFSVFGFKAAHLTRRRPRRATDTAPADGPGEPTDADHALDGLISSNFTIVVLALTVLLALLVDLYERDNLYIISQLGLWIHHYVEPHFGADTAQFYGWEQFLRAGSSHQSWWLAGMNWASYHLLTLLLYGLFLLAFCRASLDDGAQRYWFLVFAFALVHAGVAFFAVASHVIPGNFHFSILGQNVAAERAVTWSLLLSALLFLLHLPEFIRHAAPAAVPAREKAGATD